MNTTTDVLKYFMKFPSKEGVLKNFENQEGDVPGYSELTDFVNTLPEVSLIPDIKHFLFGTDDKMIDKRFRNMKGAFMFFEYDRISSGPMGREGLRSTKMEYGLTLGHHNNQKGWNMAEHHLVMSAIEEIARKLIELIENEDLDKCAEQRLFSEGYNLVPLEPEFLFGNIGWILRFSRSTNTYI